MLCSTAADSLKWYMTFLTRPEVLQLNSADIEGMITPKLDHCLLFANGTVKPSSEDAAGYAQGMSTHGSPNTSHGVRLVSFCDHCALYTVTSRSLMIQSVFVATALLPSILIKSCQFSARLRPDVCNQLLEHP